MKYLLIFFVSLLFILSTAYAQSEGARITVKASSAVSISGSPVEFAGNMLIGKEVLPVSLSLTSPDGKVTDLKDTTDKKGDYKFIYTKAFATGQYIITAKTADEKGEASDTFNVTTISGASNDIQNDFFKSTETLQKSMDALLQSIEEIPDANAQKAKLEEFKKKLSELKAAEEKVTKAIKYLLIITWIPPKVNYIKDTVLKAVVKANEEIAKLLPGLEAQAAEIKNKSQFCEKVNAMIEVCGFVSLVLDFKKKLFETVKNLTVDKVIPGILDRMVTEGSDNRKETQKAAISNGVKTTYAAAQGASGFASFVGTGLSLDIGSYLGKLIYAKYCEDLKGNFGTTFKATFGADNNLPWWIYDLDLKGEMKLRYKKNTDLSKGAEITGEVTGYRVRYGITEDFEQQEKVPDGMLLLGRLKYSPKAIDLNYFNNDIGAIAMAGIPGSFRVQVKGIVNNKNELRLQVVESPLDAETEELNKLWIIIINPGLPVPIIRKFEIPIAKNKVIIKALLKDRVFKLAQENGIVTLEVKDQRTKLPLGNRVSLETKLNLSLSNKESKINK